MEERHVGFCNKYTDLEVALELGYDTCWSSFDMIKAGAFVALNQI
jgi:hypothetical protein